MTQIQQSLKMILEGTFVDIDARMRLFESQAEELFTEATLRHSPADAKEQIAKMEQYIKHTEEQRNEVRNDPRYAHELHLYEETFNKRIEKAKWHIRKLSGEAITAHR